MLHRKRSSDFFFVFLSYLLCAWWVTKNSYIPWNPGWFMAGRLRISHVLGQYFIHYNHQSPKEPSCFFVCFSHEHFFLVLVAPRKSIVGGWMPVNWRSPIKKHEPAKNKSSGLTSLNWLTLEGFWFEQILNSFFKNKDWQGGVDSWQHSTCKGLVWMDHASTGLLIDSAITPCHARQIIRVSR